MNKKQSPETLSKRLIPMAELTKVDDSRRNYSNEFAAGYLHSNKKKSDLSSEQPISSPNTSSYTSGRNTIDAQTYVDAQSNGFTSRIVRYEEENKKKSAVYNRMYKRPGDFPIVHLDKPKLVLSAKRTIVNPPKIARIGQPDPSIYRTNIRAEILRNGTLMPQISVDRRDNDVDSAIVRVDPLDALKEISRKRIHCEDTINQKQIGPIEKDSTDSVPSGTNFNNSKRQRINNSSNSPSTSENNKKNQSYSKSNEIFSSLSSSSYMLSPPSSPLKRVESTSPSNSVVAPQTKRLQPEKSIEPPTPPIEIPIKSVPKASDVIAPKVVEKSFPTESRPKLTLFNRPYSTNELPPVSIDRNDRNDECNITFVKPRPMTTRSRDQVENWLKMKPDEKKRLSLMLSCLSGELDDGDTVDSKDKEHESPASAIGSNQNVPIDCPPKEVEVKRDAQVVITPTVSSTAQSDVSSTTASTSITKPTITFTPLAVTTTSAPVTKVVVDTTTTTAQVAPAVEERKGGFSFPMPTKVTPQTIVTASSTVTQVSSTVTPASSTLSPVLSIVTPSSSIEPSTKTTTEASKDSTVSYTFQIPKPKAAATVAPNLESSKGFTFGNTSTTSEPKSTPTFGFSNTAKLPEPQSSVTPSVDPKKPLGLGDTSKSNSFSVFAQSISAGNVDFGKTPSTTTSTSTAAPASIFGTAANTNSSSNEFNKAQSPSFGSISTTQQPLSSDKPISSNMTSLFSKNEQTQIFGSALSNNPGFSTPKQLDSRTSIASTTTAFTSNQPSKPTSTPSIGTTSTAPFTFGTPATISSVFQTAQPTLPSSSSFGSKPINSTTNIFGSPASQASATTSIFGSTANPKTNLFDQTPNVSSNNNPIQNPREPAKTAANTPNIFGSSAAKPSSTFSFSGNSQSTPSNIFGGQAPATGNFGGSAQKSDVSSGSNMNKAFSFGGSVETTKPAVFGNNSGAPTFGSSNTIDSAKSFGFTPNNQTNANNLFSNKSTNEVPKVFSFGGNSNTPAVATNCGRPSSVASFGAASNTPSFGGINSTKSFGATGATPTFGSSFGTSATPAFGGSNSTPVFGGSSSTPAFGGSSATSAFGGSSSTPAFGGNSSTPAFGGSSSTPVFGGSSSTPAFGGSTSPPAFGGSSSTPAFGGNGSTPAFGGSGSTPTFGGGNANATPTFGSSGTQAFNGNIATPTFGGVAPLNNSGGPVFGNSGTGAFTTSTGTADVNKTFNFTGNDPTPSPIPNLFNIGPGSSAPRGRTIRTATRRTYR